MISGVQGSASFDLKNRCRQLNILKKTLFLFYTVVQRFTHEALFFFSVY